MWKLDDMAQPRELIAHLLRRATFGPFPGQVESFDGLSFNDAVSRVMATPAQEVAPLDITTANTRLFDDMIHWWPRMMRTDQAGIHEKMTFFWHSLIPSSMEKCDHATVFTQHLVMRKHAMGNVRDLLQEITIDAAMLQYLDGAGSFALTPNENYSREIMELFALGRDGGYTEGDVRAGAKALSGWWIDWDNGGEVKFRPESALGSPVTFLGKSVANERDVVNAIVDHPNSAPYIASRVHQFFCGAKPADDRQAELGKLLRDNNFEIAPVVESVLRHPTFVESMRNRARTPVEWVASTSRFLGVEIDSWPLLEMGMRPFSPPNVAGWPSTLNWFSAGAAFSWAAVSSDNAWQAAIVDSPDLVTKMIERAGIYDMSESTLTAINAAVASVVKPNERAAMAYTLIATSPEFVTA
jgi:uncharacterized protein (DUF1800 family)